MKQLLLLIIVPFALFGQKQVAFTVLVSEARSFLEEYNKLAPFEGEYFAIADFKLSQQEIIELRSKATLEKALTKNLDSVEYFVIFYFLQEKIINKMNQIITHSDFNKYDIEKLFSGSSMDIITSDDKKLVNLSFDENTGGTYRSRISFVHFADFVNTDQTSFDEFQMFFPSDGFNNAYSITTDEGIKYVLSGMVRTCSLCFDTFVYLIKFSNNKFEQEFTYTLSNRDWDDGVNYDNETKTITVSYHIDDLTTFCQCSEEGETNESTEERSSEEIGSLCTCQYVFNGVNFDFVKPAIHKEAEKVKK